MPDLAPILRVLRRCRFVDLTHAFEPSSPHNEAFTSEGRVILYHYDEGAGTCGHRFLAKVFGAVYLPSAKRFVVVPRRVGAGLLHRRRTRPETRPTFKVT